MSAFGLFAESLVVSGLADGVREVNPMWSAERVEQEARQMLSDLHPMDAAEILGNVASRIHTRYQR